MIARPTKDRSAVGYDATTGRVTVFPAGTKYPVYAPDDGESVCGWTGIKGDALMFWPARLDTVAQLENARLLAEKLGAELGGSPLTSRVVFEAMRTEVSL